MRNRPYAAVETRAQGLTQSADKTANGARWSIPSATPFAPVSEAAGRFFCWEQRSLDRLYKLNRAKRAQIETLTRLALYAPKGRKGFYHESLYISTTARKSPYSGATSVGARAGASRAGGAGVQRRSRAAALQRRQQHAYRQLCRDHAALSLQLHGTDRHREQLDTGR